MAATDAARSLATMTAVPFTSYAPYSKSGWNAMARFDGMVQGVVVQIKTDTGRPASAGTRVSASARLASLSGNSTVIDGDTCGSYSTSASASAVRQCVHQCTGFLPL